MAATVWMLMLLAGCTKSPDRRLDAATKSLTSWASTASLVAKQWSAGELPDPYVKKTATIAKEEIEKLRQEVAGIPSTTLATEMAQVDRAWTQLGRAVESRDRNAAAALIQPMHDVAERLERARTKDRR